MAAFGGRIPAEIKAMVYQHAQEGGYKTAWIGCSGSLTVERALWLAGVRQLHGNDVTIYSAMLGAHFAGQDAGIELKDEARQEWGWLSDYWNDSADRLASFMQVSTSMQWWAKPGPYYERMFAAWRDQFPQLHEKTLARIENYEVRLASYESEDVFTWLDRVPDDAAVMAYPPFIGFADVYARDYAKLDALFDWEGRPEYEFLEGRRLSEFWQKLPRFRYWSICSNEAVPELEDCLTAKTKKTNRSPQMWVYTQPRDRKSYLMPRQVPVPEPVMAPRLGPHEDLGDEIALSELSPAQFSTLRSQYMSKGIRPGRVTRAVAVTVDGIVIGAFAFMPSEAIGSDEEVYMLSDFPVAPSKYKRLAKLIVTASLSREAQIIAQRMLNSRCRKVSTTAFTNKPVSMKYRGIYKLAKREKTNMAKERWAKDIIVRSYYDREWDLKYDGNFSGSLTERFWVWRDKHGDKIDDKLEVRVAI